MSARVVAILVVLLVVLGGAALLLQREDAAQRPQNAASLGRPLLKDLKAAEVTKIRIVEPKATLTLVRKEEGWAIEERAGFPADLAKVREFVIKLLELKVGQSEPIGEADRARLNLDDPANKSEAAGTRLELDGAGGKPLARLIVGKKYFRGEVDNPARALADGRFVGLPAEPKLAYVVSDPLAQASAKSADWIDRTSFQVEKVKSLEVRYPAGGGWRLARAGENAPWKLADQKRGEKVDTSKANAATYSLSLLELADVAPKDAAGTGLDKPTVLHATTLEGRRYEIRLGALQGEDYYLRFDAAGGAERPREKMLSDYVLLVPKSKFDDTLKKRAELLEKKEARK
jgi:hypothetical protein